MDEAQARKDGVRRAEEGEESIGAEGREKQETKVGDGKDAKSSGTMMEVAATPVGITGELQKIESKKKGRPTNLVQRSRERATSLSIVDLLKRKREETDEYEIEGVCKRSLQGNCSTSKNKDLDEGEREEEKGDILKSLLEEMKLIRSAVENGRKETERVINQLSERIEKIESRWLKREEMFAKRLERVEKYMEELNSRKVGYSTAEKEGMITQVVEVLKKESGTLGGDSEGNARKMDNMDKKIFNMEWRMERQERAKRKNNVVVRGLELKSEKPEVELMKFLKEEFHLEEEIKQTEV